MGDIGAGLSCWIAIFGTIIPLALGIGGYFLARREKFNRRFARAFMISSILLLILVPLPVIWVEKLQCWILGGYFVDWCGISHMGPDYGIYALVVLGVAIVVNIVMLLAMSRKTAKNIFREQAAGK